MAVVVQLTVNPHGCTGMVLEAGVCICACQQCCSQTTSYSTCLGGDSLYMHTVRVLTHI